MRTRVTSKICMTRDLGVHDTLFGGNMLAWMDEAAAIYARQMMGTARVVSLRFGEILFKYPVKLEDVIDFYCENPRKGNTSLNFDIVAEVRGQIVFKTECTFVAVDGNGHKCLVDWSKSPLGE